MKTRFELGRFFGVNIGVHASWLPFALLIVLSLTRHFRLTHPEWTPGMVWALAILLALLFFGSLVLRELLHAFAANAAGMPVRAITLFALGGVSQVERDASDARTELFIGIVGPIPSALIGTLCLALAWGGGWSPMQTPAVPTMAMLVWLGYINLLLAGLNTIPIYPLNGGRVLRAALWWVTQDFKRSTQIAAQIGEVLAFGLIVLGLLEFFADAGFGGLWFAIIGWLLLQAARASSGQIEIDAVLLDVRVGDVMARDCPVVDGHTNLLNFTNDFLLFTGRRCFMVGGTGAVEGLITPHEVKKVERRLWPFTTVNDVMRRLETLRTVKPETLVTAALKLMVSEDVNQLPVVSEGGHLEGILTRGNVLRLLQTHAELRR